MFKLSCIPDPPDPRDRGFQLLAPKLTPDRGTSAYIIIAQTPISDQLNIGSCVANAWMDMCEILLGLAGHPVVQLSRLYFYGICRMKDGTFGEDFGTYLRTGAKQAAKIGACPETLWPYNTSKVFERPPLACTTVASDNRIKSYYRIDHSNAKRKVDDIETAIRAGHPVVFGTAVGPKFMDYSGGTFFPEDSYLGRHAMIVHGVRVAKSGRREFLIRNSWGTGWGQDGLMWADESWLESPEFQDIWVGTMIDAILV